MNPILYTVRPGNTVYGIAQFFGTTVNDIARYNGLVYPFMIYPGQELRIPVKEVTAPQYYAVRPGDTLWSIAQRYGLDVQSLINYNNFDDPNIIYPGQIIRLTA